MPGAPTSATITDKCDGTYTSSSVKVTAQHGKVFYIDSGQGQNVDAAYVSYKIDNTNSSGGASLSNIWVKLDNFVGGVVQLANQLDESQSLGSITAANSESAFFLLKAPRSSSSAQSHVVRVYSGNPSLIGATELYSCTFSFIKVAETIKAAANKVTSVTTTSISKVGETMTITVEGNSGTVGAGSSVDPSMIWITPAARSTWPTQALRLESTSFTLYDNPSRGNNQIVSGYPKTDTLKFSVTATTKYYYTAVYTFRIIGTSSSGLRLSPLAQISSGTQTKHTDLSSNIFSQSSTLIDPSTATVSLKVYKDLSTTVSNSGTDATFTYSIQLDNTAGASSINVDLVTDSPDSQLTLVPNQTYFSTTKWGTTTLLSDPAAPADDPTKLVFSGPFTVPNGASRYLTYKMKKSSCTASTQYSFVNSATAKIGTLTIGSNSNTFTRTTAAGTCGSNTTTVTNTDVTLGLEASTNPASSITTSQATLNATIDPNGAASKSIDFEWGTTTSLGTTTNVGTTSSAGGATYPNSSSPYAVSKVIPNLSAGTTYYFRINFGGVRGEILSFTTTETPANPTAVTTSISNVSTSGNNGFVTFNGSIDPNQITNGVKVRFEYASRTNQSSTTCSGNLDTSTLAPSSSTYVQSETDSGFEDALFAGAFSTDVSYLTNSGQTAVTTVTLSAANNSNKYCFRIVGYYNAAASDWATAVYGEWVPFTASNKSNQTITFNQPNTMVVGGSTQTATATSTSSLTVSFSSNSESVCTVSGTTITAVAPGTCSITASQSGDDSYYEATPVTQNFTITGVPTVVTHDASNISSVSATLDGEFTANGNTTNTYFDSCEALATCNSSTQLGGASPSTASGGNPTTATYNYTGLSPATTYYYRARGVYGGSTNVNGNIKSFTTLGITTASLPNGTIGSSYSQTLAATGGGGSGTYEQWTIASGSLPPGLSRDATTGVISGTPTTAGTYTFTVTVNSLGQTSSTKEYTIVISAGSPAVTTVSATSVTTTSATIRGTVTPNGGSNTVGYFEYCEYNAATCNGTAFSGETQTPVDPNLIAVSSDNQAISTGLTNLTALTTYYFRAVATNSIGTSRGSILNFTTSAIPVEAPTVVTSAATTIGSTSATLNGSITAGGASTTSTFLYCAASASCTSSSVPNNSDSLTATQSPISGNSATSISVSATNLTAGTTYYYKAKGVNSADTVYGSVLSFTTLKVTTTSVGNGVVNTAYTNETLAATGGGSGSYSNWTVSSGSLPTGLTLNASTGVISGTPTVTGTFTFTVTVVRDSQTSVNSASLQIVINTVSYTITYFDNGKTNGSPPAQSSGLNNVPVATPGTLVKTGHSFRRWNTDSNGNGNPVTPGTNVDLTQNVNLYPEWTPNKYRYDKTSGGGTTPSDQTYDGNQIQASARTGITSPAGYTFEGWCTASVARGASCTGSTKQPNENLDPPSEEVTTLYAIWAPIPPTTDPASGVTKAVATINGKTTGPTLTNPKFCYRASSFTTLTGCTGGGGTQGNASGNASGYSLGLSSLQPSTIYYYIVFGEVDSADRAGAVRSFKTLPSVVTDPGTSVTARAATLNATTSEALTTPKFCYNRNQFASLADCISNGGTIGNAVQAGQGLVINYSNYSARSFKSLVLGNSNKESGNPSQASAANVTYTLPVSGLSPNTVYYFIIYGTVNDYDTNQPVTYDGGVKEFTTPAENDPGTNNPGGSTPQAIPGPTILEISKSQICSTGTEITINGTFFDNSTVTVDGVPAQIRLISNSSMRVLLPQATAGKKTIRITTPQGSDTAFIEYVTVGKPVFEIIRVPYLSQGVLINLPVYATNTITYRIDGTLPSGLAINGTTGLISGTATENGIFVFTIIATGICGEARQFVELDIDSETPNAMSHRINFLPGSCEMTDSARASFEDFISKIKGLSPRNIIPDIYISGGSKNSDPNSPIAQCRQESLCDLLLIEDLTGDILTDVFTGAENRIEIIVYWPRPNDGL